MLLSVAIAEDHSLTRRGIATALEDDLGARIAGVCGDGVAAVDVVERHRPDVVVLDLALPGLNGLDVLSRLQSATAPTRPVVFSGYANDQHLLQVVRRGAFGYVLKSDPTAELLAAVRAAGRREYYLSPSLPMTLPEVRAALTADDQVEDRYDRLTLREREVLQLVAEGRTSADVGERLGISKRTVDKHRQNILAKLGLSSAAALIQFALQRDLIRGPEPPDLLEL
jgi:DNA-binding NarL/FixJ family response regulator